ncbi:MAG: PspC domain-containing protein [Flavobacteriales bacterium]|nr:PspC domain-containing protein [Flavobacteriales bacterium]
MSQKRLERKQGKLLGVCAGIADYMDIDPTVIRIAFILFLFFAGGGVLLYLILALVMPKAY